jgi:4-amino-4-deoxy-L-arabinose transferase-like glycosyltransferase
MLAALTKGIAGLLLLPGLFLFALLQRKTLYILRRPDFYIGLASFVLVIGGYYLLREKYNPGYLEAVRQNELGGRYLNTLEENRHPFLYYVKMLTRYRYKDWALFIIPAWVVGFYHSNYTIRKITLFTLLCAVSFELIISSAATKLSWYDLPVYPFLAIQLGVFFYIVWQWIKPFVEKSRIPSFIVAAVLIGILVRVPFLRAMDHIYRFKEPPPEVESHKQGYFLQDQIRKNKDLTNYTFCFDEYYGQLSFYIDQLKTQHIDVNLKKSVDSLPPGRMVVVSLEKQKNELLEKYKVDSVGSEFGCTVYRVRAPIP